MDYKNFIKPGTKVLHLPERQDASLCWFDPCIVTIGNYRPYYRDGSPDPKPEEYNEWNYVEVEETTEYGESQLLLYSLLPIVEEKKALICDGKLVNAFAHTYDEEENYYILDDGRVVDFDYVQEPRTIYDLSYDELTDLRKQICLGSLYLSDYKNGYGIDCEEASYYADEYENYLREKYGNNWHEKDSPEEFADYFLA